MSCLAGKSLTKWQKSTNRVSVEAGTNCHLASQTPQKPVAHPGTSVTSSILWWISTDFLGLSSVSPLVTLLIHVLLVIAPAETGDL
jgi:hypothetical protein